MHTGFTKEEFEAFKAVGRDGPIHMLNLVRVRETADYPDGRRATGAEAYAAYGRDSAPVLARVGGRIVWRGAMEVMLIGPRDEQWDYCFIAEYPSPQAFIDMIYDPDYRRAMVHRQAGCSDSRLIRMKPQDPGATFAE